jgi:hypothetical protein
MEQLVDNLGSTDVSINAEDVARIDALAPPMSTTMRYYDAAVAIDLRPNHARW